jgi:hypothetical protein
MTADKVELLVENENLRKRLAECQNLWIKSMNAEIERTAQLMLAQYELLGEDLENDQPELYGSLQSKANGSWLQKGLSNDK